MSEKPTNKNPSAAKDKDLDDLLNSKIFPLIIS